jgi:hypothetical protein
MPDFESGAFNRALPPLRRGNSLRIRAIRAGRSFSLYRNQGSESGPTWEFKGARDAYGYGRIYSDNKEPKGSPLLL